jgi:hypothetical protein
MSIQWAVAGKTSARKPKQRLAQTTRFPCFQRHTKANVIALRAP